MLSAEVWMDIKHLHREGQSIKAITRLTGHSRNTVRRVLWQPTKQPFNKPARHSLLDEFKPYVTKRYQQCALSSVRLLAELKPMGYRGSLATLRRFTHTLQAQQRAQSKLTVRYETPPGEQGQADWTYRRSLPDQLGKLVSVYAFVMVLSFSRLLYVEFTRSMKHPCSCSVTKTLLLFSAAGRGPFSTTI
jgi:transposase